MICASLGFGSLLIVQAKPLRELGFGGVLGNGGGIHLRLCDVSAFSALGRTAESKLIEQEPPRAFWSRPFVLLSLGVILISAGLGLGLAKVNTDPSLLDYFKSGSKLRDGLEYVDNSGGCNPLNLVVSAADGSLLNTGRCLRENVAVAWGARKLQRRRHRDVAQQERKWAGRLRQKRRKHITCRRLCSFERPMQPPHFLVSSVSI